MCNNSDQMLKHSEKNSTDQAQAFIKSLCFQEFSERIKKPHLL